MMWVKNRFEWALGLAISAACFPLAADAAVSDFVCRGIAGQSNTVYYGADNNHFRDCTRRTADPNTGMCQEQVECAYFPPSTRNELARRYAQDRHLPAQAYDQLPAPARDRVLEAASMSLGWHPSTLSCQGHVVPGANGGPVCPRPDRCKDDTLVQAQPAAIDFGDVNEVVRPKSFVPAAGTAGAGGSNPAPGNPNDIY